MRFARYHLLDRYVFSRHKTALGGICMTGSRTACMVSAWYAYRAEFHFGYVRPGLGHASLDPIMCFVHLLTINEAWSESYI